MNQGRGIVNLRKASPSQRFVFWAGVSLTIVFTIGVWVLGARSVLADMAKGAREGIAGAAEIKAQLSESAEASRAVLKERIDEQQTVTAPPVKPASPPEADEAKAFLAEKIKASIDTDQPRPEESIEGIYAEKETSKEE